MKSCVHVSQVQPVEPHTDGCEECMKLGEDWVHLRVCMQCGHVGCCDDSRGRHATKHFHKTRHPVMRSAEPGEEWGWCYLDGLMLSFEDPAHPAPAT